MLIKHTIPEGHVALDINRLVLEVRMRGNCLINSCDPTRFVLLNSVKVNLESVECCLEYM